MTKSEFIQHIKSPQSIDGLAIVGAQELVSNFPYCQSVRLILSKAFHASENINFDSELRKTAAYAGDRKRLHELIFTPVIEEKSPESIESTGENQAHTTEEIVELKPEDALDQQIMSSAINSSILLEVSDELPEIDQLSPSTTAAVDKIEIQESLQSPETIDVFNQADNHSFSDWMHYFENDEEEIEINQAVKPLEASNLPSIEQSKLTKKEFYSPSKMARLSVQEDDDLVTETLASIYAQQGNYEKSIKAYEKLQLKYPEKRVYFAGRIKEIQNQKNS